MARTHERPEASEVGSTGLPMEDILIMVDPAMGHYLLRVVIDDLGRTAGASREWLQEIKALAHYLHDTLPECLRIPVPTTAPAQEGDRP